MRSACVSSRDPLAELPALVVTVQAVDDADGDAAQEGQPGPVGQALQDGETGAPYPILTRTRKSASAAAIFRARGPQPKFRLASSSIPARRLRVRSAA